MKHFLLIATLLVFSRTNAQEISGDSLIAGFQSGRLFIVNELAIASADPSFFNKLAKLDITNYELLNKEDGKELYGTLGSTEVIRLTVTDTKKLAKETVKLLDASILKYFNTEDSTFYYTNGIPNNNIYYALDPLLNLKIDEIRRMGKNEAMAVWGSTGERGAVYVNCKKEELKIYEK
ncbi:hypothetical protein [Marinoscillum sp. MHG1-6]|uniref:hypothetical protein n=1 Tax=Marinoscillum sp. MHG1-6 TaxID=2959627 RepID=UPI0021587C9B|nr:hypothetical protein [Marinoscillum sp. MHG1-6]